MAFDSSHYYCYYIKLLSSYSIIISLLFLVLSAPYTLAFPIQNSVNSKKTDSHKRYDRDFSDWNGIRLVPHSNDMKPDLVFATSDISSDNTTLPNDNLIIANLQMGMFLISFECTAIDMSQCPKAQGSFLRGNKCDCFSFSFPSISSTCCDFIKRQQ